MREREESILGFLRLQTHNPPALAPSAGVTGVDYHSWQILGWHVQGTGSLLAPHTTFSTCKLLTVSPISPRGYNRR